jgi:hypothetical protein
MEYDRKLLPLLYYKHNRKTAKTYILSLITFIIFIVASPAQAAVQMGGHMDFVLNNGRTIRVFPEAMDIKPIRPGNILPHRQKVNTKPAGGDPCIKLEKEYNKRAGLRKKRAERAQKASTLQIKPNWIKKTKRLKRMDFRRMLFLNNKPKAWYYLPSEPRVSIKNNIPEATFVKFITDETGDAGGTDGGLFHLMVTYGLTKEEETELREALQEAIPGAVLKGMVDLEPSKATENFIVTSGTLSDEGFAPSGVLTSGRAPSFPGAKAAIAGRLSSLGAQLMEKTFENPTSDLSVTFAYDYIVKTQAYKAEVRIDMDRIQEISECTLQTMDKVKTSSTHFDPKGFVLGVLVGGPIGAIWGGWKKKTKVRISEKDIREGYETMISLGAIEIRIDQNLPDADVSAIESSLMQMAMESFTSMQKSFSTNQELQARKAANASDADKELQKIRASNRKRADNYELYTLKRKQTRMTGVQTLKIEKGIALYRTHSMTGNIGGILREYKDEVFDEVLLNDPFFKRGEITVDLDTEALDLFAANMINNASVKVIVPFSGQPYENGGVFTRSDISSGGIMKKFTFATRGEDMSSKRCTYKYIESWSLKGGGKWPKFPKEKCAKEMAVTLVPPITLRRIDVEADLDEMEQLGIRGADVIFRHKRYGANRTETARFRVAKGEAYLEHTLYVDKDNQKVDYKIVLTHKTKGKFSSDWQTLEDDFVYANLSGLPLETLEKIQKKIPEIKGIIDEVKGLLEQ